MNLLKYYKNKSKELTRGEKKIAEFMGKHPQKVATSSALELAKEIGVSDASIVRFSRSIGFKGFSDLKSYLIKELGNSRTPSKRIEDSWGDFTTDHDIVNKMISSDLRGLQEFLKDVDIKELEEAIDLLNRSRKIYVMGIGASRAVAEFLAWHMKRMMFYVECIQEGGVGLYESLTHIESEDVLLLITFPGYLEDELRAIKLAKMRGAKVITVTSSIFSEISLSSDLVFKVSTENEGFFNSYVVAMELCNIFLMGLLERNKEKVYKELAEKRDEMEFLYFEES